ncbi:hypothetical protein KAJ61_01235 [Candidatus Parcubacteria bacterium]|nr:hypothetical protein [Candidatus Parcubacteria bacterium]
MIHALYVQWGNGLQKEEVSETEIFPNNAKKNFVLLTAKKKYIFEETLPRNIKYLKHNGISIVKTDIDKSLWR